MAGVCGMATSESLGGDGGGAAGGGGGAEGDHRASIFDFFRSHTAYDMLPESGRVVLLDANVPAAAAFSIMAANEQLAAPVWDSNTDRYLGMLTPMDMMEQILHCCREDCGMDCQTAMNSRDLNHLMTACPRPAGCPEVPPPAARLPSPHSPAEAQHPARTLHVPPREGACAAEAATAPGLRMREGRVRCVGRGSQRPGWARAESSGGVRQATVDLRPDDDLMCVLRTFIRHDCRGLGCAPFVGRRLALCWTLAEGWYLLRKHASGESHSRAGEILSSLRASQAEGRVALYQEVSNLSYQDDLNQEDLNRNRVVVCWSGRPLRDAEQVQHSSRAATGVGAERRRVVWQCCLLWIRRGRHSS